MRLDDLSAAQRGMLLAAAERPKTNQRTGRDTNFTWVGKGRASSAKKLEALGLGAYVSDGYSARFWIWGKGYELAAEAGVTPGGTGEKAGEGR